MMVFGKIVRITIAFGICVFAGQDSSDLVFSPPSGYPPVTLHIEPAVNGERVILVPLKTTTPLISESAEDLAKANGLFSYLPSVVRVTGRYKFDSPQKIDRAYISDGPKEVDFIQCYFTLADGRVSELFQPGTIATFDEKQAAGVHCMVYLVDEDFREIFIKFLESEGLK